MSDKNKSYEWLGEDDELTGEKDIIAQEIMGTLRMKFSELVSDNIYETPFLYGGSVNADNAADFSKEKDINGALVGGASLNADSFINITKSMVSGK